MLFQTRRWLVAAALALGVAVVPIAGAEDPEESDVLPALSAYQLSTLTRLDPRDRTRANGVLFARACMAENARPLRPQRCSSAGDCPKGVSLRKDGTNGRPTADHPAILQTMENKRLELERKIWRRPVRLREAIRVMAPHVAGDRPLSRPERQLWLRTLPSRGRKVPDGYGDPAVWRERQGANWERFRAWAIQAVTEGYWPPLEGHPLAYGGNIDWPLAVGRGMCVLEGGDLDTFWAFPGNGCELTDPRTIGAYKAVEVMKKRRARYLARRRAADTNP